MNKKRKTAVVALLSVFAATTLFAACEAGKNIIEIPTDKDYGFQNPDRVYAQPDEGVKIDGRADEDFYRDSKWVTLNNKNGTNTVELTMTSRFGEKGMYFVYDITENTPIYVNHDRASYINSGIEMYFAPQGVTSMSNDHVYEIDLEADGAVTFKKRSGAGDWVNVESTDDIMAYAASQPKGGEINSGECFGYTLEFFIPWDYISWLGMNPASMKEETVSVSPVHITSYNYSGTQHEIDRYWYPFASQLGGDGFHNVGQYFKFDKNGVVGTLPVTLGTGEHCTISGPTATLEGLPVTVTVTPEEGYALSAFSCKGSDCLKFLNYNKDGSATFTITGEIGLTFAAAAEKISEGNKNLTGKINLKKAGGDTTEGLTANYTGADGTHTLTLAQDGTFALNDLPQGYYEITAEKQGYGKVTRGIYLNRDIDTQIDLEYGTFDVLEGSCWDYSRANEGYLVKKGGRGIILSKNSYDTVYAEANFRYDENLAASSGNSDDKEQRSGFRMKFSGGKFWSVTLIRSGNSYGVMYAQHNADFIFGWDTVHVLNAKQIAKYKSGEGIALGILRDGTTAYLYLDGEIVHTENLASQGIKADERVQVGFEAFYYNAEPQLIPYTIQGEHANEVALVKTKEEGGTVTVQDACKVGDDVRLVLSKTNSTHVLLSLLVNGVEMSGAVISDESGAEFVTIEKNTSRTLNVEIVYGVPQEITANIAVDRAWKANGIEFTFTNAADKTLVKKATVAGNKMQIANMLQGRWLVSANVFGKALDLGSYSVVSEEEKQLGIENVFVNGKLLDPSIIDLATGSFLYHSAINEDYSIRINETGDAFLAAKIKLGAQDKATFLRGGEVSFGMYMTVEDANGNSVTHWTDFWLKNADGSDFITVRTDFGWGEDFCKPFTANVDLNKYSKALFGDGLYVVLRYTSQTGIMETYFGANDFSVEYLRDWNDKDHLFPANGTLVQAGFRDNLGWGDTSVTVEVNGFRYGKTLLDALGVAGKKIALEKEVTGGIVELSGAPEAGENAVLTVEADNGKILGRLIVNGVDMTELVEPDGTLTIKNCTAATLSVEAAFVDIVYAESVEVSVNGRKYGVEGNAAEGKTATLTRGKYTYEGTVKDGRITFENVMIADRYTLTVEGFVAKTGLSVTANGIEGVSGALALEYDAFYAGSHHGSDWNGYYGNPDLVDKSHANDVEPYFTVNGTDFYQYATESYDKVAVSMTVKAGMTDNNPTIGLVFEGHKAVMLRIERQDGGAKYKVQWIGGGNWEESCINGNWDFGDGEEFYNPISGALKQKYETTGLKLTLVRNGGLVCAFVDDVFLGSQTISDYAKKPCSPYFAIAGVKGQQVIPFTITDELAAIEIADETAADANGTVTVAQTAQLGELVTVRLNPIADHKVLKLLINGTDVTNEIQNDAYTFIATQNVTVKATFEEIVKVNATVTVNGKKLGVEGNAANGLEATLSDGTHTYKGAVTNGKVMFEQVVTGANYTLSIAGYRSVTGLEVTESGIQSPVDLVFDTMNNLPSAWNWGDGGRFSGEYGEIYTHTGGATMWYATNESFDSTAMVKVNVKPDIKGRQGAMIKFGNDYVMAQLEATSNGYKISWNADGGYADWGTGVNNITGKWDSFVDPLPADLVEKMNNGELFITLIRNGNRIYGYVNDVYCGMLTISNDYASATCQVGFYGTDVQTNAVREYYVSDTIPAVSVTNGTVDENGTVTGDFGSNLKAGDSVTLTLIPNSGYLLKTLTVGGKDVTGSVVFDKTTHVGTYVYTNLNGVDGNVSVVAVFEQATYGAVAAEICGSKYGDSAPILLNGARVTLSNSAAEYTVTVADGKITLNDVLAGTYTLTAEGYLPQTVTITAGGTYAQAIALVYQIFTSAPASADLSKISEGKVTATGNGNVELKTKESYTDVSVQAHFDVPDYNSRRYGITLDFADGKNFRVDFAVQDGGNNILQQTNWDSMMFNWEWVDFPEGYFAERNNNYTEAEIRSEFIAKGLTYKLERTGATVKLYINDVLMKTYTLPESYAAQAAQIRFIQDSNNTDGTKGFTFDITVPEATAE